MTDSSQSERQLRAAILARICFLIDTNRDVFSPPPPTPEQPAPSEHEARLWRAIRVLAEERWPQLKKETHG